MLKKALILSCILALIPVCAFSQTQDPIVVTGMVTDETGSPLPGANVFVLDHPFGAATDPDGVYRFIVTQILLDQEITIKSSFIGHRSKTLNTTLKRGLNEHTFALSVDVLQIEEIVVTGMGIGLTKEKLGVTIAKVSPQEIVNSDESNIVSALSGKVANVEVTSSSGDPGAGAYIRIRGVNSISGGTQPLFVVDGSPINNQSFFSATRILDNAYDGVVQQNRANDLNPEDIESIEILKGAAAAAMYGSRAANGVILITTTSGKPGTPRVSYKLSYSFDEVTQTVPLQTTYGQGTGGAFVENYPGSWGPKLSGTPTYDHANELFDTGHKLENNLTISGGGDRTTYFLSFGRTNTNGIMQGNSNYIRDAFRLKATQFINDKISVTGNLSLAKISSNRIQQGSNVSGLLLGALRTPPDFNNQIYLDPETGYHRSYRVPNPTTLSGTRGYDNPFFILNELTNISKVNRFFGNFNVDYDPLPWLNINYTLGYDFSSDQRRTVFPLGNSAFPGGRILRDEITNQETDSNLLITAQRNFAPANMNLTLMAGQNLNESDFRVFTTQGDGVSVDGFDQLGSASNFSTIERQEVVRIEGYFAQGLIDLWNQLYLTVGLRNDGASVFSADQKRHWYPKISSAWDFTKLSLMQNPSWFTFGKLRAAYGQTGRVPAAYSTITGFSTEIFESPWGETLSSTAYGHGGFITDKIKGQENIKPERAKEFETGIDFGFLNNRLGLDLTYYNQRTTDVIYSLPLPPSTGFDAQVQNAGTITNTGIEIGISSQPINKKDLKWTLDVSYARNRNKVTKLPGADFIVLGPFDGAAAGGVVSEGYPFGILRSADYVRFGREVVVNGVDIDQTYSGWQPGDLYIAENGYPTIDPALRIGGDPNPNWTGSIRNSVTLFNNLQLSILFDIKNGGNMWNGTKAALVFFGTHKTTEDREGTQVFEGFGPGQGQAVSKGEEWYAVQAGSLFTGVLKPFNENAGYVKLREIAASYTLRNDWIKHFGLSDITLRLSGRNFKTWTDYTGVDPEANLTGSSNLRGQEYFNNPQARSITFAARLNY